MPKVSWLAALRRLRGSLRGSTFEREMASELQMHMELEAESLVARGLQPAAARLEARRRFGSIAEVGDACRDSWGVQAIDAFAHDMRHALRVLAAQPGYAAIVVLTLALGIGANTAIFSVVHAVLLRSLPYTNGDRLVELHQRQAGVGDLFFSAKEMDDYRQQATSLDAIVEYHQMGFNLLDPLGAEKPTRVVTGVVSAQYFDVIGVQPILGRTFRQSDDRHDAPAVIILSHHYWQTALGADPHVVGRTFQMNDRVHTVVGVLPAVPQFPENNDVYMPVSACPFRTSTATETDRRMRMVSAIARLKPGISLEQARAELALIASRLAASYPDAYDRPADFTATADSVREQLTERARPTLLILLATTGFMLVLVCANVANLMLARLVGRSRELVLRAALGAGRSRIVRQLLAESTVLAIAGGVLGVGLAFFARDLLVAFATRFTLRASEIRIDTTILAFALVISVLTGALFGGIPAVFFSGGALKRRSSAFPILMSAQVAISFVLLIGAGLMVRSFVKLREVDAGFSADHVLTARVDLDWVRYDTPEARRAFFRTLLERAGARPGVETAALSLTFPLNESTPYTLNFVVKGRRVRNGERRPRADFRLASPDYFRTIGMSLLRGRVFTSRDRADTAPVAVVNASMARRYFGDADPVGQRVSLTNGRDWITIVGLVNDVKQYGLDSDPSDELYLPFDQGGPLSATLLLRTPGEPMALGRTVEALVHDIDPHQPVSRVQTLEQVRTGSLDSPRLTTLLVTLFAGLALLITATGIAGVVSFSASRRTAEIGVRVALGARRGSVMAMIVRQGLAPVIAGLAVGLGGALLATRAVARFLYAVEPTDPLTYGAVVAVLVSVAALACLVPARRAASIDPMLALRSE